MIEVQGTLLPLFSSRKYQTKHTQFRVKIGPNKMFGGEISLSSIVLPTAEIWPF